ncbi:MAG: ribosome maturation factor RimM [Bacillota bacterium]|nr:ribosome maturation factor RimM [Bacillota bacterium]
MKEMITIGQIINTHGLKGELKVYPLTDDIRRYRKLSKFFIDGIEKKVVWCKLQTDRVILKLEDINTIEEASNYKNKYIEVKREDAVKLEEGRFFIADIIGCSVIDTENVNFGTVYDVIKTGSNDVYWVKGQEDLMVPALESVVVKIDIENKQIVIKPLEQWQ